MNTNYIHRDSLLNSLKAKIKVIYCLTNGKKYKINKRQRKRWGVYQYAWVWRGVWTRCCMNNGDKDMTAGGERRVKEVCTETQHKNKNIIHTQNCLVPKNIRKTNFLMQSSHVPAVIPLNIRFNCSLLVVIFYEICHLVRGSSVG